MPLKLSQPRATSYDQDMGRNRHDLTHLCGGRIVVEGSHAVCDRCADSYDVDELGIVQLSSQLRDDLESPYREFLDADSLDSIIEDMLNGDPAWPADRQARLLDPTTGVAALLADLEPFDHALDLATGWNRLGEALESIGANAVCADWSYGRLRLSRMLMRRGAGQAVHLNPDDVLPLPWDESTFDAVFVNLDELVAVGSEPYQILGDIRRVLRPNGVVVLGAGREIGHRRRRSLIGAWRRCVPVSHQPAVRRAGFVRRRLYFAWPRRGAWRQLVPADQLAPWLRSRSRQSRRASVAWVLGVIGAGRWLADSCLIVASARHGPNSASQRGSVVDRIAGDGAIINAMTEARVSAVTSDSFTKIPLSTSRHSGIVLEIEKTDLARRSVFEPFVVSRAQLGRHGGIPFAKFPRIEPDTDQTMSGPDCQLFERITLSMLGRVSPAHRKVSATDIWALLIAAPSPGEPEAVNRLRNLVRSLSEDKLVPAGPTHGDLHPWNFIVSKEGKPLIVDWVTFQPNNPLLIDSVSAAITLHSIRQGIQRRESMEQFVDGKARGDMIDLAHAHLGQLSPLLAASLTLLTYEGEWRGSFNPSLMWPYLESVRTMCRRLEVES
jgi:SAM-dependent methyltransferase